MKYIILILILLCACRQNLDTSECVLYEEKKTEILPVLDSLKKENERLDSIEKANNQQFCGQPYARNIAKADSLYDVLIALNLKCQKSLPQ